MHKRHGRAWHSTALNVSFCRIYCARDVCASYDGPTRRDIARNELLYVAFECGRLMPHIVPNIAVIELCGLTPLRGIDGRCHGDGWTFLQVLGLVCRA